MLAALPAAARKYPEDILATSTYQWKSEFARTYAAKGMAQGKAEDILTVLEARGLDVPEGIHQRVTECADLDQLNAWLRRAATVERAEDLLP